MESTPQILIDKYTAWMEQKLDQGWDAYILTCMFRHIPGSMAKVAKVMEHDLERVLATYITRVFRNPRSPRHADHMPIWVILPDFPVPKRTKSNLHDVTVNGGRHLQGYILHPPGTRLVESLDEYFLAHGGYYARQPFPLDRIEAKPITETPERVVDYLFKSLRRGRIIDEDIIILPRSRSELAARTSIRKG